MSIWKRLTGFRTEKISAADEKLIESFLNEPEKFLFFQMSRSDQDHSLAVAKTILKQTGNTGGVNLSVLIKAALLHDVGKVDGDFTFLSRIAAGIVRRLYPTCRGRLAALSPAGFWERLKYGFYVDLIHPARGSYMAGIFGTDAAVTDLIRRHHDSPKEGQEAELTWLQLADGKN